VIMPEPVWNLDLFQKTLKLRFKPKCACNIPGTSLGFDKFNIPLRRYYTPKNHVKCPGCPLGGGALEELIHMVARSVNASYPVEWYDYLKSNFRWCAHDFRGFFKEVTSLLKLGGVRIHQHWEHLCYWELALGFSSYKSIPDFLPEVQRWLGTVKTNGDIIGEDNYCSMLYEEAVSILQENWHLPEKVPTIEQWVAAGDWMLGQAGTGPQGRVTVDHVIKNTRRKRAVDAAALSDREVSTELRCGMPDILEVIQKSEGGKVRPVVKAGNAVNRKMGYLSTSVEAGLRGARFSPIFSEESAQFIDRSLVAAAKSGAGWFVPLDQSNFDQNQSKRTVLTVLRAILDVCCSQGDLKVVGEALWRSLCLGAEVRCGTVRFPWVHGMPSGWRWTALLDTMLNITSFRVVCRIVGILDGMSVPYSNLAVQGDDVIFTLPTLRHVPRIMSVYEDLGYEINAHKTFLSRSRGEFLRRLYTPGGVFGYLSRSFLSIRFRNPITMLPRTLDLRVRSRVTNWQLVAMRGGLSSVVAEMMLEDCVQAGGLKEQVADFLVTPSAVGGVGISTSCVLGATIATHGTGNWVSPVTKVKQYGNVKPHLGKWLERLVNLGLGDHEYRGNIDALIAESWGIDAHLLRKKVELTWNIVPRLSPITPGGHLPPLPRPESLWDLDDIPKVLRGLVQRIEVRKKLFRRMELWTRAFILEWQKRMSTQVFSSYLLGNYSTPVPTLDRILPKYLIPYSSSADEMLRKVLANRGSSALGVMGGALWIENWLADLASRSSVDIIWGA